MSTPQTTQVSPTSTATSLKKLPLDALHRELGAKFGGFAGYDMPLQYPAGLKQEHLNTRAQAGLFDVSHMGQLRITAPSQAILQQQLEAALPIDFEGWEHGADATTQAGLQKYSVLLNEQGGIEDDLMLVNLGNEVRMVVNAGNRDKDLALLQQRCPQLRFEWVDASLIALQGPASEAILAALDPNAANMRFMQSRALNLLGAPCFTTRSGYTGEDGYEISVPASHAEQVVRALLADARAQAVGLAARDTLRLEAGLPLHGNDILPTTSPVEAGLNFAIPKSRRTGGAKAGGFIGAQVVLQQLQNGVSRKLQAFSSDEAIPIRSHAKLVSAAGTEVGEVTSGTVSPTLGKPIVLAYVNTDTATDASLFALVRDKKPMLKRQTLPFVPKQYKR